MTAALAIVGGVLLVANVVGTWLLVREVRVAGDARASALTQLGAEQLERAKAEGELATAQAKVTDLTDELARTKAVVADQATTIASMNAAAEKSVDPTVARERLQAAVS